MVVYLREYYRKNKNVLLLKRREYYEANREAILRTDRRYRARNAAALLGTKRRQYERKDVPTVHERALEAFGFRTSENGGRGFRIHKCKCGCGLPINAAHVAVVRLFRLGYSRQEIAQRLGVHPTNISQLKLEGTDRAWAWYRRGHGNLATAKPQPAHTRRRLPREVELRLLVEQQDTEVLFGERQKSVATRSLDAVVIGTDDLTLIDTIEAPVSTGDFTEAEESLFDWLVGRGVDLDELAERCLADPRLAAAMAESLDLGAHSAEIDKTLTEVVFA
jgi:hypothetical protein